MSKGKTSQPLKLYDLDMLALASYRLTGLQRLTYLLAARHRMGIKIMELSQALSIPVIKVKRLVRFLSGLGLLSIYGNRVQARRPLLNRWAIINRALDDVIYLLLLPHRR